MNWPLLLLLLAFITAYAWLRNRVRRWIVDQWVADRMDNRQVAWLLVASYMVPIGAAGIWVGATTPNTAWPAFIFIVALVTVLVAGTAGLLDYLGAHGLKDRISQRTINRRRL